MEEGEDGIPINNIMIQGISRNLNFQIQIIIVHHPWDINIDTQSHIANIHTPSNNKKYQSQRPTLSPQATNICQLCHSQGHYDYQCQFAGDFMACTQKAFNQGRSYSHQVLIKGNGHKGKMITMTLMGNLFSSRGSRCC